MDGFWILLGMMGAGKSTVGRTLARLTERPFLDTDNLLEQRFGRPVAAIFAIYGEEAFRGHETSVLRGIERQPGILSTGGGIVLRPENWDEFRRLGTTIYLDVPPDELKQRLARSKRKRPLLQTENWHERFDEIYSSRIDIYRQADLKFTVSADDMDASAQALLEQLEAVP